ncbi:type I-E CRISPR-associated protein Cas6/Cse3/CasE [Streptomyces sp. NPDC053474]|uniref:type I-E CRISPR-associated protein Cas6/Cse3/CasE n=1 Tax=Streptomyces sp. NPDC053474 TaxID=3365704 RepID=UPI0037D2B47A
MTYLTRCHLNPARAHHLTAHPQRLHAAIASAFPPAGTHSHSPAHRALWRLDETTSPHRQTTLLIVSATPPDLTHVIEQAGWPHLATREAPGWNTRPYQVLLDRLKPGLRLYFRLTANPTYMAYRPEGRGARTAHTTPTHQLRWLLQQAPNAGFQIPPMPHITHPQQPEDHQATVISSHLLNFSRTQPTGRTDRVHIRAATYEGHLDVADPDTLRHTLTHGLGRAKAYGCGLLTLAPTRTT